MISKNRQIDLLARRGDLVRARAILLTVSGLWLALGVLVAAVMCQMWSPVVAFLFGKSFRSTADFLEILAFTCAPLAVMGFAVNHLYAMNLPGRVTVITCSSLLLAIPIFMALIHYNKPSVGVTGGMGRHQCDHLARLGPVGRLTTLQRHASNHQPYIDIGTAMRILITGGAGFIGSNLALALNNAGHEVTVLDSLSPQIHGENPRTSTLFRSIESQVTFIEGSVTEESAWLDALEGQEAVVHLAAKTGTGQSMYEIKRYVNINVGGTASMLNLLASRPHSVRKVVVASSRAVYGEGKYRSADGIVYPGARRAEDMQAGRFDLYDPRSATALEMLPTDEDSKIHPSSVYGITKHGQEQLVMTVCPALGIAATALRYQNVYGPGQSLSNPYTGILSIFSTRILHGRSINVFEDGRERRDFVYVDDVVQATVSALMSPEADGEVFGIGSGVGTSVLAAAQMLVAQFGRDVPIQVSGAYRLGDIRHNVADLSKARRLLGYEPTVDFETGIARFVRWVLTQPRQPDAYDRSLGQLKDKGLMHG